MSSAYPIPHIPPPHGVPDHVIDNLLGRGLNAAEWQTALQELNYSWKPILRNAFIRRELWFFKNEIEWLLEQPSFYNTTRQKSNSCRSILMYIQGHSGDRQQRLDTRRLCGPEIACRTLEAYVKAWRSQPAITSSFLVSNTPGMITSIAEASYSAIPDDFYGYSLASGSYNFELPLGQVWSSPNPSYATLLTMPFESESLDYGFVEPAVSDLGFSSTYSFTSTHWERELQNSGTESTEICDNIVGDLCADFYGYKTCFPTEG